MGKFLLFQLCILIFLNDSKTYYHAISIIKYGLCNAVYNFSYPKVRKWHCSVIIELWASERTRTQYVNYEFIAENRLSWVYVSFDIHKVWYFRKKYLWHMTMVHLLLKSRECKFYLFQFCILFFLGDCKTLYNVISVLKYGLCNAV